MSLFITLYALLGDLNLREGNWTLIGVSLPNYAPHPLQKQFPAFLLRDREILLQIQSLWQAYPAYEDHCDYHYVLKIYQDCHLRKTLRVNLSCGYITEGANSYRFSEEWLLKFSSAFQPAFWGQVWFREYPALRAAAEEILKSCELYSYEDLVRYRYEGKFIIGADSLAPQLADSVVQLLIRQVRRAFPEGRVQIHSTWTFADERGRLSVRIEFGSGETDFQQYGKGLPIIVGWQPHLVEGEPVRVILLGDNPKRVEEKLQMWQRNLGASLVSPQ
ncbi:MAG: hypothetical protein NZ580_05505 [Bacteroidia bacterium]|nr:hypothetical protein [Bacteroidia bacterium]MDW8236332.1 hypothetical protein [Bacteroidia bacterium]